jgi:hypothetical protein
MKNDQSKNSEKLSTLQVDEDYIQDDFNLSGLGAQVPYYDYALDLILDADAPGADRLTEEQHELVESAAEVLYGLIHARFVLTGEFIPDVFFCLPAESSEGERREGRRAKKKKKGGKRDAFSKKKKKLKIQVGASPPSSRSGARATTAPARGAPARGSQCSRWGPRTFPGRRRSASGE